jgi:hypothetical protein
VNTLETKPRVGVTGWRSFAHALAASLALSFAIACGPDIRVKSSFDPHAELDRYGTFAMLLPNKAVRTGPDVDPFVMQRLRQMTFASLKARGLQSVERAQAQLLVGVQAAVRGRVDVYPRASGYGYYYGPAWGYPYGGYDVHEYDEAVIVIDLVDAKTRSVVWRGTGVRTVSGSTSDEEMRAVIDEVLNQYPPGAQEAQEQGDE